MPQRFDSDIDDFKEKHQADMFQCLKGSIQTLMILFRKKQTFCFNASKVRFRQSTTQAYTTLSTVSMPQRFDSDSTAFKSKSSDESFQCLKGSIQTIGNIHDNPELLAVSMPQRFDSDQKKFLQTIQWTKRFNASKVRFRHESFILLTIQSICFNASKVRFRR